MKKRILVVFLLSLLCTAFCQEAFAFSINVVDGNVREVLRSAARMGAVNLVLDDSVQGKVTVNVDDVAPEEAIRYIALARGLSFTQENGTIIVSTKAAINSGFSSVHVFPLKYGNPEDMLAAVKLMDSKEKAASDTVKSESSAKNSKSDKTNKDGKADRAGKYEKSRQEDSKTTKNNADRDNGMKLWVDSGTNSLLLYGTQVQADAAESLIKKLDVPAKQVSLEAKIVSVEKNAAEKMGISFEYSQLDSKNIGDFNVTATIDALAKKGRANVLSRPNIMTVQGREAVINIGGDIPIPTSSVTNSTTTTSFEYKQTGIILRYIPYINANGMITAKVHTEVSTPSYDNEVGAYKFSSRSADTMVRLRDGETMVIGGLIGKEEVESLSKVPFLSEIPILGKLFTNKNNSKTENEIVIFLTARLMA